MGLLNKIKNRFFLKTYVINYVVINYKAELIMDQNSKFVSENIISTYESKLYSYIVKASSPEQAEISLNTMFDIYSLSYRPRPKLKIISIVYISNKDNKLHLF